MNLPMDSIGYRKCLLKGLYGGHMDIDVVWWVLVVLSGEILEGDVGSMWFKKKKRKEVEMRE